MLYRNPKDGKECNSDLTELQAVEICEKVRSDFPRSLARQWRAAQQSNARALSPVQYYWLFKLAEDNNTAKPVRVISLFSDLTEFIAVPTMQFKVQLDDTDDSGKTEEFGKVLLRKCQDSIAVFSGYRFCGKIIGCQFFPSARCWNRLIAQIQLFSANPQKWMEDYGKATGYCCVCGRELTNEESVSYGIGPICREKFGF